MKHIVSFIFTCFVCSIASIGIYSQNTMSSLEKVKIVHISNDFSIDKLDSVEWNRSEGTPVTKYWSGESSPVGRHFFVRLLWSDTSIYVRFEANQNEPLIISDKPDLASKTKGLWDRDVCEIFLAPDRTKRNRYFEFEVSPTGEWIDVGIIVTPKKRISDWDYSSGIKTSAKIGDGRVVMSMKIPFAAFEINPKVGDIWLGNLFRCVGDGTTRGYLSWKSTGTKTPNFHVPSKFGEFEFVK